MLYAGSLFDDEGNLNASLGAHELEIEVAQAGEDGASASYRFGTRTALIGIVAGLRVRAPNVSDQDKANRGVPYATNFVANWGDEDGQRLMPGALGYTVYRVVDDKRASRLFGRESWGLVQATAVGVPVEGMKQKDMRGEFGYPSTLSPPVSTREKEGKPNSKVRIIPAYGGTFLLSNPVLPTKHPSPPPLPLFPTVCMRDLT